MRDAEIDLDYRLAVGQPGLENRYIERWRVRPPGDPLMKYDSKIHNVFYMEGCYWFRCPQCGARGPAYRGLNDAVAGLNMHIDFEHVYSSWRT